MQLQFNKGVTDVAAAIKAGSPNKPPTAINNRLVAALARVVGGFGGDPSSLIK